MNTTRLNDHLPTHSQPIHADTENGGRIFYRNVCTITHLYTVTAADQNQQQICLCAIAVRGNLAQRHVSQRLACLSTDSDVFTLPLRHIIMIFSPYKLTLQFIHRLE